MSSFSLVVEQSTRHASVFMTLIFTLYVDESVQTML